MGFFSGIKQSIKAQGEKRKTLKSLENRTASENLRIEKENLMKEKDLLKQRADVKNLKRDIRNEKLAPITESLARIKNNLKSVKDKSVKRSASQVRRGNHSESKNSFSDAFGLGNKSPFSQNSGKGSSAFELGRSGNNPFRKEVKKKDKDKSKEITIKIN